MLNIEASDKMERLVEKRRNRDDLRRERFMDAKARTIGIDIDALDHQVEEKRQMKLKEKDAANLEAIRLKKMCELLEVQEKIAEAAKKTVTDTMKTEWRLTTELKQSNNVQTVQPDEIPSAGAMLSLSGEDTYKPERVRLQQQQMRQWVDAQVSQKNEQRYLDNNESSRLRSYLENVTRTRTSLDQDDVDLRRELEVEIQDFNMKLAETKRQEAKLHKDESKRLDREEIQRQCDSSLLCEDTAVATAVGTIASLDVTLPRRIKYRRDMFRGYSDAQRKGLLSDNTSIIHAKQADLEAEKQSELSWVEYQRHVCAVLEKQAAIDLLAQQQMLKASNDGIALQADLSITRREEEKKSRMGQISEDGGRGIFEHFGKSCR